MGSSSSTKVSSNDSSYGSVSEDNQFAPTFNASVSNDLYLSDMSEAFKERARVKRPPEQHASWLTAAQLMIADIVGVGVLTLAGAMADLGWLMGIIFIVVFFPVNLYTGLLLWDVRLMYPGAVTYMDMARYTFSRKWGKFMSKVSAFFVYLHIFLVLGDYVLVIGLSLGLIFYDLHICKQYWILIGCFFVLPFNQIRNLNDTRWLCWLNMGTITAACGVTLGYLVYLGRDVTLETGAKTELIASDLDIWKFAGAFSKIAFAYAGQFLYLEILAEMKEPRDFPKSFIFSGPYQVGMYLLVGTVGYYYKGDKAYGMLIDFVPFDIWMRIAGLLLFFHMIITYLIKGNVMSRAIHLYFWQDTVNSRDFKGSFTWFCITTALLASCFVVANAIPFFEYLSGLIGSLLVPFACWNLPIMYYVSAKNKKGMPIRWWEWIPLVTIFIFGLVLTVTGTKKNIEDIINGWEDLDAPWICNCHGIHNTCECSPGHIGLNCST